MDAEVYPNPKVSQYITENFVPAKMHVKENGAAFHRFEVQWTPTLLFLDGDGKEQYRFEGYLPADDFLARLDYVRARAAFKRKEWLQAAPLFDSAAARDPKSEFAAEAGYWAAVSRYQKTHDPASLVEWSKKVRAQFPASTWAKRGAAFIGEESAKA